MELNELKSIVANAKKNEENAEQMRLLRMEEETERIINILNNKWMGKIRNWIETLNYLASNGYILKSPLDKEWKIPEEQKRMCTDGFYHTFGLVEEGNCRRFLGAYCTHFNYMGITQGGACGEYNIRTDGNTWWTEKGGVRYNMRLCDYKELMDKYKDKPNKLERFETDYNALINMIKRKAQA